MWLKRILQFDWLQNFRLKLSLQDILWFPVYAAVFFKIKGDSFPSFGTYVWVILLTLVTVGCLRQVYFLLADPDKQLKGLTSFRVTVGFTRLLAACLIFLGANWPSKGHWFEHFEPSWTEHSPPDLENFVGFLNSVASGHVASNWLQPIGIFMAFLPFCRPPSRRSVAFSSRLIRWAMFIGLACVLSWLLLDLLLVHSLVWIAIYGIDRSWSMKAWPPDAVQTWSSMGDVEQTSFAAAMMVVGALVMLGFVFTKHPTIRVSACISSVILLFLATFSAWHTRMHLVPSISPTFRTSTEPLMPIALLLMGLVAILSAWILVQILIQNLGRQPIPLPAAVIRGISFPPVIFFVFSGLCVFIVVVLVFRILYFLPSGGIFGLSSARYEFAWPFNSELMTGLVSDIGKLFSSKKCPMRFEAEGLVLYMFFALAIFGFAVSNWRARKSIGRPYVFQSYGLWSTVLLWGLICWIAVVGAEVWGQCLRSQLMSAHSFTHTVALKVLPESAFVNWLPYTLHFTLLVFMFYLVTRLIRRKDN
jgi:hypothetical protein